MTPPACCLPQQQQQQPQFGSPTWGDVLSINAPHTSCCIGEAEIAVLVYTWDVLTSVQSTTTPAQTQQPVAWYTTQQHSCLLQPNNNTMQTAVVCGACSSSTARWLFASLCCSRGRSPLLIAHGAHEGTGQLLASHHWPNNWPVLNQGPRVRHHSGALLIHGNLGSCKATHCCCNARSVGNNRCCDAHRADHAG